MMVHGGPVVRVFREGGGVLDVEHMYPLEGVYVSADLHSIYRSIYLSNRRRRSKNNVSARFYRPPSISIIDLLVGLMAPFWCWLTSYPHHGKDHMYVCALNIMH